LPRALWAVLFGRLGSALLGGSRCFLGDATSLLDAGVDQVTLLDDGEKIYGPMSLHPAG
jgi:hypothetical protein